MAKTQRHHVCPVSLQCIHFLPSGRVNEANLIDLSIEQHNIVHQTLNIHYTFIREFIMKHSWKVVKDDEYYDDLHKMQDLYFARLHHLTEHLQKLHAQSMKAQCVLLRAEYKVYIDIHENAEFISLVEMFKFYHGIYFQILKRYAKKWNSQQFM